uniref:Ig-like domain-containing protein n=1 Tax=Oryzias latipes TaxID=8090 RepID=A0A3P9J342_ORYLA
DMTRSHIRIDSFDVFVKVSETFAVSVGDPKSVQRGQTVLMPCWLNPSQNAENLEIRWYREDNFDTPAILKMPGKADVLSMEASFIGRVSFHAKDATSGGLKMGDVSLQLKNVTIKDEGKYTCYYEDSGIDRKSNMWKKDNSVNVSCESEGWFPQPELRWSEDQTKNRVRFVRDSSGLVRVHSWIVVNASSEVSCSVGLPNTKAVVVRLRLDGNIPSAPEEKLKPMNFLSRLWILQWWMDCFHNSSNNPDNNHPDKLEDKQGIVLRDNMEKPLPDGVPHFTAITGAPGFSHGKHYWEVSLSIGSPNVPVKLSWWIGVTSSPEIPQREDFSPNTSNGFWFLSSSAEDKDHFQFSTVPQVRLPVHSRPQTVGVFLDYDQGELSFYDVDCGCIIGSLTAEFKGQVFPLFNPGKGETAPMKILQRTEQSQNVDPVAAALFYFFFFFFTRPVSTIMLPRHKRKESCSFSPLHPLLLLAHF